MAAYSWARSFFSCRSPKNAGSLDGFQVFGTKAAGKAAVQMGVDNFDGCYRLKQKRPQLRPFGSAVVFLSGRISVFVLGGLQRGHLPLGFSVPALGGTLQGNVARALQRLRNDTVELYRKIIALRAYAHNDTETARVDGLLEEFPWAGAEAQPVKSPLRSAKVTQMTEKRCFMIFVLSILCSLGWENQFDKKYNLWSLLQVNRNWSKICKSY